MNEEKQPLKIIAGAPEKPLIIGNTEIPCYVLEDETRVFVQRGMAKAIGLSVPSGSQMARFVGSKTLNPFISKNLKVVLGNPIRFVSPGGIAHGYPATILVDLCKAVLEARDAGVLQKRQHHIAQQCDNLIRNLAAVGVIALVDEATGYQDVREKRALATILEKFIAKDLQPWTKTFPYEFYEQIFRLRNWPGPEGAKKPQVIGHYTNNFVYERLAPGVLEELKKLNPTGKPGQRKHRHHQWFTPDPGYPKLQQHLAAVTALMRAAPNWTAFLRMLERAFPKPGMPVPLPYDPEEG